MSALRNQTSILAFASLIFGIPGSAAGQPAPQVKNEIQVYPFTKGTRKDSIVIAALRVSKLQDARKFFEKSYLRKELVFIPLPEKYDGLFSTRQFLMLSEIKGMKPADEKFKLEYDKADASLQKAINSENRKIYAENKEILARIRNTPQIQEGLLDLSNRNDYEILFSPRSIFLKVNAKDPRENQISSTIKDDAEQILLGKPHNIDGYVNSINYQSFNLTHLKMPDLVEALLQENLRVCKKIIRNADFSARVNDIHISYRAFDGSTKLWTTTNLLSREIYLSPYLIRAVFNMSLYEDKLFKLAEEVVQNGDDLQVYFQGKSGASAKQVDSAYFTNFVERFSKNIMFIIGHELGHVYLPGHPINTDIESACDDYSAYFYLSYFHQLELGIFENLLIKSISSNELDFWGKKINKDALLARYKDLTTIKRTKDIKNARCKIDE